VPKNLSRNELSFNLFVFNYLVQKQNSGSLPGKFAILERIPTQFFIET